MIVVVVKVAGCSGDEGGGLMMVKSCGNMELGVHWSRLARTVNGSIHTGVMTVWGVQHQIGYNCGGGGRDIACV